MSALRVGAALLVALALCAGDRVLASPAKPIAGAVQPAKGGTSEFDVRARVYSAAADMFARSDFAALDARLAEQYGGKLRTPSGVWQGGVTFAGITDSAFADGAAAEAKARAWLVARPASPFAPIALVAILRKTACAGCGLEADEATRSRRAEDYELAMQVLEQYESRSAAIPEWHNQKLLLGTGLRLPEARMREFYEKALRLEPGYFPVRFAWVSYQARQQEAMRRVVAAARATAQEPPYPDRDALNARMLWWAIQSEGWEQLPAWEGVDWPALDHSFTALLASYPDDWNRNNYARIACLAGHPERTIALMKGRSPQSRAWSSDLEFRHCTTVASTP